MLVINFKKVFIKKILFKILVICNGLNVILLIVMIFLFFKINKEIMLFNIILIIIGGKEIILFNILIIIIIVIVDIIIKIIDEILL